MNYNILNTRKKRLRVGSIVIIVIIGIYMYSLNEKEKNIQIIDEKVPKEILIKKDDTLKYKDEEKDEEKVEAEVKEKEIIIHVDGEVKKPGIVKLKEGDRIIDAIEKAGGVTNNANLKDINLAQKVEDGIKIFVYNNEQANKEQSHHIEKGTEEKLKKININSATQTELETIPGIGPSTAKKIIEYRDEKGKFKRIEDLKNIKGIGESKFLEMKKYLEV